MINEEIAKNKIISCSYCNKKLMGILISDPNAIDPKTKKPFLWEIKATCPYCGGVSFKEILYGRIHPTGYARPNPDSIEDVYNETYIEEEDYEEENKITFKIKKAN